ncbi:MAG: LD-carboxypeptidase [Treponema sp.]|nr:LD-carboxypeptidase [Treponema sp.]
MKPTKPKALLPGSRVGLIAPSGSSISPERVDAAKAALAELGFEVAEGRSCRAVHGYLAGDDATRASDVNDFFADRNIDGIFCMKGGYGTPRILDRINYDVIRAHPKVFVGYSDITGTHLAIGREGGLVTFHGPMPYSERGESWDGPSRERLLACVGPKGGKGPLENPAGRPLKALAGGRARGRLVGGNLSLIAATMGTPWEIETRDRIVFMEDIGERPYRVDRMLTQLRLAGKLAGAAGFILGDWNDCGPEEGKGSLGLDEVLEELLIPTGRPVLANLAAGHCRPNLCLPLGVEVAIDADRLAIEFLEAATE